MPVHRIPVSRTDGIAPLVDLVAGLEADGVDIVGVLQHAGEWVVVARVAKVETR
jgi:hypothetical protein